MLSEKICSVCLQTILPVDLCLTNCNHEFCKGCLDKWFNSKKSSCPLCRTDIQYFNHQNNTNRVVCIIQKAPVIPQVRVNRSIVVLTKNTFYIMNFVTVLSGASACLLAYFHTNCNGYTLP